MKLGDKMPAPFISDSAKRFTLRMDSRLFEQISHVAKLHRRSVAKEIECAVESYLFDLQEEEDSNQDVNTPNY